MERNCDTSDAFWRDAAVVADFATGIKRSTGRPLVGLDWLRAIGVRRLEGDMGHPPGWRIRELVMAENWTPNEQGRVVQPLAE
eukprot:16442340-Heterocapsa_arctica.AAC.1